MADSDPKGHFLVFYLLHFGKYLIYLKILFMFSTVNDTNI